ncbi:NADH dehydrogenase [ubiquinone] 1 alpha subcomplex subunit 8-like [Argonauta hians]
MPFTEDDWLPSYEELCVPELELTSSVLRAGSLHYGKYCDYQCKEFMLCRAETKDPRRCLTEGKEVTRCAFEFFGKVKTHCADQFNDYWQCIDHAGNDMNFSHCRKTQKAFDECVQEKLGIERPYIGYFSKVRIHDSQRPKFKLPPQKLPEKIPEPPNTDTAPLPNRILS